MEIKEKIIKIIDEIAEKFQSSKDDMLKLIELYVDYIIECNEKFNLVSRRNTRDDIYNLIIDCLGLIEYIKPDHLIIDIGSGSGMPGIPISIALPYQNIQLIEINLKKSIFLTQVIEKLNKMIDIESINAKSYRIDITKYNPWRDFSIIEEKTKIIFTAKAFAKCLKIAKICEKLIKNNYPVHFLLLKGPAHLEELEEMAKFYIFDYKIHNNRYKDNSFILEICNIALKTKNIKYNDI